ncbi:MAG: cytochrome c oxidase subunit II [Chloroflexota bacterium]|nr:cytochrome c oxidase subunit II [Chloroflexota bacterium]
MRRRLPGHGPGFQATPAGRATGRGRAASLFGLAAVVALLLAGCGEASPYSQISPRTEKAGDIQGLYEFIFWAAAVVFVGVQVFIVYTVLRWRRRNEDRPEQIHGNRRLELAWTIIPAVVLLAIFIPTAQLLFAHAAAEEEADFVIDVYGKQWWWEFHYPNQGVTEGEPLITANEVRVPQGADVVFNLRSNNVIHAFYPPQLSGKTDVIPGHNNKLQFDASTVGEYFGECTEYCGTAHAWMRFKVIVEPEENFVSWVQAWRQPPPVPDANPQTAGVVDTPASFGVCLACHNITGTQAVGAQAGMGANVKSIAAAPNLTLFGCRDHLAGGVLENTRENVITWLKHTDETKPGAYMPNYYLPPPDGQGAINDQQVEELADYLLSLKPADGCPPEQPLGGTEGVSVSDAPEDPLEGQ